MILADYQHIRHECISLQDFHENVKKFGAAIL